MNNFLYQNFLSEATYRVVDNKYELKMNKYCMRKFGIERQYIRHKYSIESYSILERGEA